MSNTMNTNNGMNNNQNNEERKTETLRRVLQRINEATSPIAAISERYTAVTERLAEVAAITAVSIPVLRASEHGERKRLAANFIEAVRRGREDSNEAVVSDRHEASADDDLTQRVRLLELT